MPVQTMVRTSSRLALEEGREEDITDIKNTPNDKVTPEKQCLSGVKYNQKEEGA
ncbi:hypothetical protein BACCAP_01709 [Pseudoflavonifractor capillosus ATCC 29799]|uniref:Uncharacterized protein n=1 Tax=Pseudoflavonifractor capillosus ATCC 29799 TaxID=411467 RepID=A6NU28_9FIRM|nr:hypothetical protein BACCAP_01709 [Pseudoflavonifractor capillosus ATCC 29799]